MNATNNGENMQSNACSNDIIARNVIEHTTNTSQPNTVGMMETNAKMDPRVNISSTIELDNDVMHSPENLVTDIPIDSISQQKNNSLPSNTTCGSSDARSLHVNQCQSVIPSVDIPIPRIENKSNEGKPDVPTSHHMKKIEKLILDISKYCENYLSFNERSLVVGALLGNEYIASIINNIQIKNTHEMTLENTANSVQINTLKAFQYPASSSAELNSNNPKDLVDNNIAGNTSLPRALPQLTIDPLSTKSYVEGSVVHLSQEYQVMLLRLQSLNQLISIAQGTEHQIPDISINPWLVNENQQAQIHSKSMDLLKAQNNVTMQRNGEENAEEIQNLNSQSKCIQNSQERVTSTPANEQLPVIDSSNEDQIVLTRNPMDPAISELSTNPWLMPISNENDVDTDSKSNANKLLEINNNKPSTPMIISSAQKSRSEILNSELSKRISNSLVSQITTDNSSEAGTSHQLNTEMSHALSSNYNSQVNPQSAFVNSETMEKHLNTGENLTNNLMSKINSSMLTSTENKNEHVRENGSKMNQSPSSSKDAMRTYLDSFKNIDGTGYEENNHRNTKADLSKKKDNLLESMNNYINHSGDDRNDIMAGNFAMAIRNYYSSSGGVLENNCKSSTKMDINQTMSINTHNTGVSNTNPSIDTSYSHEQLNAMQMHEKDSIVSCDATGNQSNHKAMQMTLNENNSESNCDIFANSSKTNTSNIDVLRTMNDLHKVNTKTNETSIIKPLSDISPKSPECTLMLNPNPSNNYNNMLTNDIPQNINSIHINKELTNIAQVSTNSNIHKLSCQNLNVPKITKANNIVQNNVLMGNEEYSITQSDGIHEHLKAMPKTLDNVINSRKRNHAQITTDCNPTSANLELYNSVPSINTKVGFNTNPSNSYNQQAMLPDKTPISEDVLDETEAKRVKIQMDYQNKLKYTHELLKKQQQQSGIKSQEETLFEIANKMANQKNHKSIYSQHMLDYFKAPSHPQASTKGEHSNNLVNVPSDVETVNVKGKPRSMKPKAIVKPRVHKTLNAMEKLMKKPITNRPHRKPAKKGKPYSIGEEGFAYLQATCPSMYSQSEDAHVQLEQQQQKQKLKPKTVSEQMSDTILKESNTKAFVEQAQIKRLNQQNTIIKKKENLSANQILNQNQWSESNNQIHPSAYNKHIGGPIYNSDQTAYHQTRNIMTSNNRIHQPHPSLPPNHQHLPQCVPQAPNAQVYVQPLNRDHSPVHLDKQSTSRNIPQVNNHIQGNLAYGRHINANSLDSTMFANSQDMNR